MPEFVCSTSKGEIEITLVKEWSPLGVKRFEELVDHGFFHNIPLFRCVDNFLCQFGYHGNADSKHWDAIVDDIPSSSTPTRFRRGFLSFAGGGINSRTHHLFITLGENVSSLGREVWETPIGFVSDESMRSVVSRFYTGYGDMPPYGSGPDPHQITTSSDYLTNQFSKLDFLVNCSRKHDDDDAFANKRRIVLNLAPELGSIEIELNREWAPLGVERMLAMVKARFLDQARVFRVVPGFVVQFGMPADPKRAKEFSQIKDDPVVGSNVRGTVSFAMAGPNTRSFQLFINLGNNARLDSMGFSPIGTVLGEGMAIVDQINAEYRELPDQGLIAARGNAYLLEKFPRLSYISDTVGGGMVLTSVEQPPVLEDPIITKGFSSFEFVFSVAMVILLWAGYFYVIAKCFPSTNKVNNNKQEV